VIACARWVALPITHRFGLGTTLAVLHDLPLAPAQRSCHDLHMQDRLVTLALLATATCLSALAQTSSPDIDRSNIRQVPRQDQSTPSNAIIDLDGIWEAPFGGLLNFQIIQITIQLRGNELSAAYSAPRAYIGHLAFHGIYSGQQAFIAKTEAGPPGHPANDVQVTVSDPDTLRTVSSGTLTYHRVSEPRLNDLPCDSRNVFHVTTMGALTRADVAADAKQYQIALCWGAVAASTGNAEGQYITGAYLRRGLGTQQNLRDALSWMIASAKQGQIDALKALVQMYQNGEGTQPNLDQARYWNNIAQQRMVEQQRVDQAQHLLNAFANGTPAPPSADPPVRSNQTRDGRFVAGPLPAGFDTDISLPRINPGDLSRPLPAQEGARAALAAQ